MYNAIHVEVQVVELFAVRIWTSRINRNLYTIDLSGLFFDDSAYDFRV
jgi:hypothetical protein